MVSDEAIEQVGMDLAMRYEREQGRQPEDVSTQSQGYDIRSVDKDGNYRYIEVERLARADFIAELSKWENSLNLYYVERARREILAANGGTPPKVLDPFTGGGSIPLEALRLGCETYASDLNPVAVPPVFTTGILAEVGNIHNFPSYDALATFAGLAWNEYQSGDFQAEETPMPRRW